MKKCLLYLILSFLIISCQNQEKKKSSESFGIHQDSLNHSSVNAETARNYYKSKNYLEAFEAYDYLIERDSASGEYHYNRGFCYMEFHNFDLAIHDFNTSIKLAYRIADANFNISMSYISQQNDSMALIYMKKYNQLKPNDPLGLMFERDFIEIGNIRRKVAIDENN